MAFALIGFRSNLPCHTCGITGTRLFPKDYSMKLDDIGNKDYIAVVLSKSPIDYNALNTKISRSPESEYSRKLSKAISNWSGTRITHGKQLTINTDLARTSMTGLVIEINKR